MMWEIVYLKYLLEAWRRMPDAPPSEYSPPSNHSNRHHRFSGGEIQGMRDSLKQMSPESFYSVFPEERPANHGRRPTD